MSKKTETHEHFKILIIFFYNNKTGNFFQWLYMLMVKRIFIQSSICHFKGITLQKLFSFY